MWSIVLHNIGKTVVDLIWVQLDRYTANRYPRVDLHVPGKAIRSIWKEWNIGQVDPDLQTGVHRQVGQGTRWLKEQNLLSHLWRRRPGPQIDHGLHNMRDCDANHGPNLGGYAKGSQGSMDQLLWGSRPLILKVSRANEHVEMEVKQERELEHVEVPVSGQACV